MALTLTLTLILTLTLALTLTLTLTRQQETGMDYLEMAQTMQALGDNSMNITLRPSLVALAEGSHELAGEM